MTERISELDSLENAANTTSLFNMVDGLKPNNKQQVRAALEEASPYLSAELLKLVGDKPNSKYPPSWFRDLILMNIEIAQSNTFMDYLKTKDSPLPNGLYKQIDKKRNQRITERGEKLNHIIDLDTRKSRIIRLLITNELSDTTSVDWNAYNELVALRKDLWCRAQHADGYLGRKRKEQCNSKLDEIHNNISDYLVASTQQEIEDFYAFKKYILSISNETGVLEGLTDQQAEDLTTFSNDLTGRAKVQAQNLLCFFTGNCEDLYVEYAPITKSMSPNSSSSETELDFDQINNIKVVPNPNKGEFIVELDENEEIKDIEMFGADGKRLLFDSENNLSTSTIIIKAPVKGVYWIRVSTVKGEHYTTKFIIKSYF